MFISTQIKFMQMFEYEGLYNTKDLNICSIMHHVPKVKGTPQHHHPTKKYRIFFLSNPVKFQ